MNALLLPDTPQADEQAREARKKSHVVRGLVALQAVGAVALAFGRDDRVVVVDGAVEQVEDVAADDGRQGHDPPVLRQACDAERVRDQRGEHAEEEAIGQSCRGRYDDQVVRVRNRHAGQLRRGEDGRRDEQAPEARHLQFLH